MGGLFGRRPSGQAAPAAEPTPVRPMPDPSSPEFARMAREARVQVSKRSGRSSTDLTGSLRRPRNIENVAMAGE